MDDRDSERREHERLARVSEDQADAYRDEAEQAEGRGEGRRAHQQHQAADAADSAASDEHAAAQEGGDITAVLEHGPLAGRRIDVDVVEGRPPKTIDVQADDGSKCRYCLADWVQTGPSATYTFLYRV
ncbi:MAG TPA: hypothetical protein VHE14_06950 [Solirubrobacteraceae bacterium]|nr:hypothetical protein [Solirubrobacteraceae bacterium]